MWYSIDLAFYQWGRTLITLPPMHPVYLMLFICIRWWAATAFWSGWRRRSWTGSCFPRKATSGRLASALPSSTLASRYLQQYVCIVQVCFFSWNHKPRNWTSTPLISYYRTPTASVLEGGSGFEFEFEQGRSFFFSFFFLPPSRKGREREYKETNPRELGDLRECQKSWVSTYRG